MVMCTAKACFWSRFWWYLGFLIWLHVLFITIMRSHKKEKERALLFKPPEGQSPLRLLVQTSCLVLLFLYSPFPLTWHLVFCHTWHHVSSLSPYRHKWYGHRCMSRYRHKWCRYWYTHLSLFLSLSEYPWTGFVVQAGFELLLLPPQLSVSWNYRHVPPPSQSFKNIITKHPGFASLILCLRACYLLVRAGISLFSSLWFLCFIMIF